MKILSRLFSLLLLGSTLAVSAFSAGCAHRHAYRVYDPYYSDYHTWNDTELGYYHRWAGESHRNPDRDFRQLPPEEQKEYWTWRHSHGDNDRRDNDRH